MHKRFMRLLFCLMLLSMLTLLGGCGEYKEQIDAINASVEKAQALERAHITMTTEVATENGLIDGYDSNYLFDYEYRIDVRTFNFVATKTDLTTGRELVPPYKVVNAHKYDLATGVEDTEYEGAIGDMPDLLSFFFGAGLKNNYVGSVESITDENHPDWTGYHVQRSYKYMERVNSTRGRDGAEGVMLDGYVDYWLDAEGVLVRMDYVSRDEISYTPLIENENGEMVEDPNAETVTDILDQKYIFEILAYNDPEIADF